MKAIFIVAVIVFQFICCQGIFAQRGVGVKTKSGKEVILYENSYALIIGNSTYKDGSWGNLPGVKADVEAVSDVLCQHGFKVEIAENLTSKTFDSRLKEFINKYGKTANNRILIYYAGHGYKQKSAGDSRDIGYVVPVDTPSPQKSDFNRYAETMDTIENYAKEIQAKHALFVFDNCFSGKLVSRSPVIVPNEINEKVGGVVRQFLTSGLSEQEVPDQSSFRRALVRGLKGEADENADGYTTASELAVFIKGVLYNEDQSPQYGKINDLNLNLGDFTFAKPTGKGNCAENVVNANAPTERVDYSSANGSPKIVESNFFTFELKQCRLSGTVVSCDLTITNKDSMDKKLGFEWNSNGRVFDESGNQATMFNWVIANKSYETILIPNVAVKGNLKFKDVAFGTRLLKRIDLTLMAQFSEGGYYKTRNFTVSFQDIPLK